MDYLRYNKEFPFVMRQLFRWLSNAGYGSCKTKGMCEVTILYGEFLKSWNIEVQEYTNGQLLNYHLNILSERLKNFVSVNDIKLSGEYTSWLEPYENAFQLLELYLELYDN